MQDDTTQHNLDLISIGDASEYLGISIDTLRRWEKKGRITPMRSPGGHRYFSKKELDGLFGKRYTRDEETLRSSDLSNIDIALPNEFQEESYPGVVMPVMTNDIPSIQPTPVGLPAWRSIRNENNETSHISEAQLTTITRAVREVKIPEVTRISIIGSRVAERVSLATSLPNSILTPTQGNLAAVEEKVLPKEEPSLTIPNPTKVNQSTNKYIAGILLTFAFVLGSIAWYFAWQKSQLILSPIP